MSKANLKNIPKFKLRDVAAITSTSVYSIRQYIDNGLIIPFKTDTNRHLFSDIDIGHIQRIKHLIQENGLNFAGIKALNASIPCWILHQCKIEDRNNCNAYYASNEACWEASEKGPKCRNTECRNCHVYHSVAEYDNLKSLIKKHLP